MSRRPIWNEFTELISTNKSGSRTVKRAKCNFCHTDMNRNIYTLVGHRHHAVCGSVPVDKRRSYDSKGFRDHRNYQETDEQIKIISFGDETKNDDNNNQDFKPNVFRPQSTNSGYKKVHKSMHQLSMKDYHVPQLNPAQVEAVNIFISLWFIEKGIAGNAFDSVWWKAAVNVLRPSYKPPSRKALLGTMLNERKEEMEDLVKDDMRLAGSGMLGIDGGSDRYEGVVHCTALLPEPRLILIKRKGSEKEDGEALYEIAKEGKELMDEAKCCCCGLVGDNCNTQKKVGRIWRDEQKTGTPGCGTHGLCLLNGDVLKMKENKGPMEQSQKLQNKFANKSKLGCFVRDYKIEDVVKIRANKKFPGKSDYDQEKGDYIRKSIADYNKRIGFVKQNKTREWNGKFKILEWQQKNRAYIQRLTDSDQIERTRDYLQCADGSSIADIINDTDFWEEIARVTDDYGYIKATLNKWQGMVNLADIFHGFNQLLNHYDDEMKVCDKIIDRWNLISDDMHAMVYFNDPRFVNIKDYEDDDEDDAIKYCRDVLFGAELWELRCKDIYSLFRAKAAPFKNRKQLTPHHTARDSFNWWRSMSMSKTVGVYATTMAMQMRATGTNTGTECTFNPIKYYMTPLRSSLGPKTLDNLDYVGGNMRFMGSKVYEYYGVPRKLFEKQKSKNKELDALNEQFDGFGVFKEGKENDDDIEDID